MFIRTQSAKHTHAKMSIQSLTVPRFDVAVSGTKVSKHQLVRVPTEHTHTHSLSQLLMVIMCVCVCPCMVFFKSAKCVCVFELGLCGFNPNTKQTS